MKKRKAQSILEYTLLLGAVVAVIVSVLLGSGGIKSKVEDAYETSGDAIENVTGQLNQGIFGGGE